MIRGRVLGVAFVGLWLAAWEIAARAQVVRPPDFLPPVSAILATMWQLTLSFELPVHLAATLSRSVGGLLLASLVGIPVGILIGYSRRASDLLSTTIEVLRPVPPAAIIPVAILFLGIDNAMKLGVITFGCLWPIVINTIAGVRNLEPVLIDTGRTLRLSTRQFLWHIVVRGASPYIMTGVRISLAISMILAIVTEMLVGNSGMGHFLIVSERSFLFREMYAGLIAIGISGYLLNSLFVLLTERHLMRWYKGYTAQL
jgi:ABC-type nitrate/sulfonate/bicarbonate transport system permease component